MTIATATFAAGCAVMPVNVSARPAHIAATGSAAARISRPVTAGSAGTTTIAPARPVRIASREPAATGSRSATRSAPARNTAPTARTAAPHVNRSRVRTANGGSAETLGPRLRRLLNRDALRWNRLKRQRQSPPRHRHLAARRLANRRNSRKPVARRLAGPADGVARTRETGHDAAETAAGKSRGGRNG